MTPALRNLLVPSHSRMILVNTRSTGKPFGKQFLTQKYHFPTAPHSSRDDTVIQCSEGQVASTVHKIKPVLSAEKPLEEGKRKAMHDN
jgi:hypothetical protein